ncbi:MAG: hotdog domain-containing protein [Actinomycetes bacterium]
MSDNPFRSDAPVQFPPAHHLLHDLPAEFEHVGRTLARAHLRIDPTDQLSAVADLLVAVDVLSGLLVGGVVAPDWMATSNLSLQLTPVPTSEVVVASVEVVRVGRTSVVVDVALADATASGDPIGAGVCSFTRLERRSSNLHLAPVQPGERTVLGGLTGRPGAVVAGSVLLEPHDASGSTQVEIDPWSRNSFGAMNGGVVAAAAVRSAVRAVRARSAERFVVSELVLHYLAPATVGPLRCDSSVVRSDAHGLALRVDLLDEGRVDEDMGPRRVAIGEVAVQPA